jgi:spermidine synthase
VDRERLTTSGLYLCLFASGVAGLIYQVLWSKYLALFVGSTGMAQVIVLCTFMGGLAMGGHFLGRRADRVRNPLKFYAYLELGIGIYALLYEPIFHASRSAFLGAVNLFGVSAGGLAGGKLVACVMSILLPTFLMGGTLPVLSRHMIRSLACVGPLISRLYFLNSLGAVVGCLLAGFFLIRSLGLQFSIVTGAALNIAAGLLALLLARASEPDTSPEPEANRTPDVDTGPSMTRSALTLILLCVAVSGGVSMMYEVAWIRLLTLVLGSSTYSFSLMLATFILGLSLGGFVLSLRKKTSGYGAIFGLSEVGVGLLVLLSIPLYVRLPYVFNQLATSLSREPATFGLYQLCKLALCAMIMFLPTVLQGITLPAATKILTRDVKSLGGHVGHIFAVNTLGTLIGAAAAGFILMPLLGMKGLLELAVGLNVVLGFIVLWCTTRAAVRRKLIIGAAAISCFTGGWYILQLGAWDRDVLSAGIYRTRDRIPSYKAMQDAASQRSTVFYRDGLYATVAVQDLAAPDDQRLLVINGKVDASTGVDMPSQKMLSHLPMLLQSDPKNVLIIGIGSGATVGSILCYPSVERVDVIEISREVIDASRYFEEINGAYWEDERAHIYREDAKTFLQVTPVQYDLIISEPTNPWIAGVAGVFSREYFEICRQHLRPDGKFIQWIQGYELENATFYLMLETFTSVYPYYTLWNSAASDTIQIGSAEPYAPDFDFMESRLEIPAVRDDLNGLGITSLLPMLAMQMADHAEENSHVPWFGVVHSDYFPVLEYLAPRGFFVGSKAEGVKWLDRRSWSPANSGLWAQDYLESREVETTTFRETYQYLIQRESLYEGLGRSWASRWADRYPNDKEAVLALARVTPASHAAIFDALTVAEPGNEPWRPYARQLKARRLYEDYLNVRHALGAGEASALLEVVTVLENAPEGESNPEFSKWKGSLLFDTGDYAEAEALLSSSCRLSQGTATSESNIRTAMLLCKAALAQNRAQAAAAYFDEYLSNHPGLFEVALLRSRILADIGLK